MAEYLMCQFKYFTKEKDGAKINATNISYIIKAKWSTLTDLYLNQNSLDDYCCRELIKNQWAKLQLISLRSLISI